MAEETATDEETTFESLDEEQNGSGPGFKRGVLLGLLAGAAAATLFAPSTGQEFRHRVSEEAGPILKGDDGADADGTTPSERIRSVLGRVRARVQEASEEAKEAARLAEEESRARFAELTDQEDEPS